MKGSLSDSWRLWVLFGMGHSPLYTKIWHQSRYQARPRRWHWSLSSLITVASSSCWEDKRKRLLGVKRVSKIMRHIPCANGVPVTQWMEAHTVSSQHYGWIYSNTTVLFLVKLVNFAVSLGLVLSPGTKNLNQTLDSCSMSTTLSPSYLFSS